MPNAAPITITFDGVADGTVINSTYAGLGVTFTCIDGTFPGSCGVDGANVYAQASATNNSALNVISTLDAGFPVNRVDLTGVIQADFASPASTVRIDAYTLLNPEFFGTPGMAFLSAFNGTTLLGTTSTTAYGTWQTLSLSFPEITSIRFSGALPAGSSALFDNLSFDTNSEATPVPEPASILLLGTGAASLIGRRLRRRLS
jgi:hypothetical protein